MRFKSRNSMLTPDVVHINANGIVNGAIYVDTGCEPEKKVLIAQRAGRIHRRLEGNELPP
jgi:hypothetical protein